MTFIHENHLGDLELNKKETQDQEWRSVASPDDKKNV